MLEFQIFQFTRERLHFLQKNKNNITKDVSVSYIVRYKFLGYSELGSHPSPPWVNCFVIPNDTFLSNSQQPTYSCNMLNKLNVSLVLICPSHLYATSVKFDLTKYWYMCKLFFVLQVLDASAREEFFDQTLPAMVTLTLRLPTLCTQVSTFFFFFFFLQIAQVEIPLKF